MAQAKSQQRPDNWKEVFIAALLKSSNVTAACRKAKISRSFAYDERNRDAEFAALWDDTLEMALDDAESEAWRRAVKGTVSNRQFDKEGNLISTTRQYSDTLLIFMLKAHRPDKYRETIRQEHTGAKGAAIKVSQEYDLSKLSLDELIQLRAIVAKTDATTEPSSD